MPIQGSTVVTYALKKSGVTGLGRAPSASDMTDGLADLNDMISEWDTQRWLVWDLLDLGIVSTGATTYTVGPGGDFDIDPRPDRLEAGYQLQILNTGNPVRTPLRIIRAKEEYSRIAIPTLVAFGQTLFLDTSYPLGILRPYPCPNAARYEIHIIVKNPIGAIEAATDLTVLPQMYIPAFKFNLARRLRQAYGKGKTPDIELNRFAANSLSVVRKANLQIPQLVMPQAVVARGSGYNILSDQFGGSDG